MRQIGSNLAIALSNSPGNDNGGMLALLDTDENLAGEYVVNEQGIHDLRLLDNDLFIVGTDPLESWEFGNLYRRQNGTWEKIRTLPNVIHAFAALKSGANYLIATGAHTGDNETYSGRIYLSSDLENWTFQELGVTINENYYTYRVMDIAVHAGKIYASIMWPVNSTRLLTSSDNGQSWNMVFDEITHSPAINARYVFHNDYLCMLNQSLFEIIVFDTNGAYNFLDLPSVNASDRFNVMVSDGNHLYVLDNLGDVWRTGDLSTWELYSHVDNAISLGYWPSQNCLVASDMGVNAKLWKIPLV